MKWSTEQYQAKARECEQKAEEARDPGTKREWLDLARQWREMAEAAEKGRW